jgi:hypothetical protein
LAGACGRLIWPANTGAAAKAIASTAREITALSLDFRRSSIN